MNWFKTIRKSDVINLDKIPDFSNYEDFREHYKKLLKRMLDYSPGQAGSSIFAERLGKLVEKYPEYDQMLDEEGI